MRLLSFLFLLLVLGSCSESPLVSDEGRLEWSGSGILISEQRDLSSFQFVHASGPVTTVISQGENFGIVVTADDNVISRVTTLVKGNTLYISLKDGSYHNIWVRVQVTAPKIVELANTGNGSMQVNRIHSSGRLKLSNTGSGIVVLNGVLEEFELDNEGAGTIKGFNLEVGHCRVTNEGSGSCELFCTGVLEGSNTGDGSILYKGNPAIQIDNTGNGSVSPAS